MTLAIIIVQLLLFFSLIYIFYNKNIIVLTHEHLPIVVIISLLILLLLSIGDFVYLFLVAFKYINPISIKLLSLFLMVIQKIVFLFVLFSPLGPKAPGDFKQNYFWKIVNPEKNIEKVKINEPFKLSMNFKPLGSKLLTTDEYDIKIEAEEKSYGGNMPVSIKFNSANENFNIKSLAPKFLTVIYDKSYSSNEFSIRKSEWTQVSFAVEPKKVGEQKLELVFYHDDKICGLFTLDIYVHDIITPFKIPVRKNLKILILILYYFIFTLIIGGFILVFRLFISLGWI